MTTALYTKANGYNRSEIMKRAWSCFRIWKNKSFAFCLRSAWAKAKNDKLAVAHAEWMDANTAKAAAITAEMQGWGDDFRHAA